MKAKLIVLMGLDGSGKSTQAENLRRWLKDSGVRAETVWMRGESYLTRPVIALGKALLKAPPESKKGEGIKTGRDYSAYVGAKHSVFRNRFLRRVWIALTILDLYVTFRIAFWKIPANTDLVVLDRYIYDSFIDIDTAFGEDGREALRLLGSAAARMFPAPDLVVLLEITPEDAMRRKDDIPSIAYLEERGSVYRRIAEALDAVRVDAGKPVPDVEGRLREIVRGVVE
jgi:thymidylate kinase